MEKTDREIRRKLIKKAIKPFEKCSFKIPAVKEPIYISKDSISEIAHRASNSYKSTLLAINIEEVVFNIKKRVKTSRPKQNNTQTRTFKLTEMYEYLSVSRGGKAKVMIGRQTNRASQNLCPAPRREPAQEDRAAPRCGPVAIYIIVYIQYI